MTGKLRKEYGSGDARMPKLEAEIMLSAALDLLDEMARLLPIAQCPQFGCISGQLQPDGEQCQFCFERDQVLAKYKAEG